MLFFEVTGNLAFDYFFSINMNIGLVVFSCIAVLKLFRY